MKESVEADAYSRGEDKEMQNRIFDLVLNMNSTSKAKAGSLTQTTNQNSFNLI
jgi:hypothetical protein